jgi:hypothetical protein
MLRDPWLLPFLLTLFSILPSGKAWPQDTTIVFRKLPYREVFNVAAQEGKPVMLYFHFDGCGACLQMEKAAFRDPVVYEFFNRNFVNLDVNTIRGEGVETNKIWQVTLHPTFLFLDDDGDVIHRIVGVFDSDEFMDHARRALGGESTYSRMVAEYEAGRRDPDFLYQYCYLLRDAHALTTREIGEYLGTQTESELALEKNILFIYEFALHHFEVAVPFGSPAYTFMLTHQDTFATYYPREQVETRLVWIANRKAHEAIENQDDALFNACLEVIRAIPRREQYLFQEVDGRTTGVITAIDLPLRLEMEYARRKGDIGRYRQIAADFAEANWNDAETLNELAWGRYLGNEDPYDLEEALAWSKRSLELEDTYAYNDTYAALLYKTGQYKKAKKYAEKAIMLAGKSGEDPAETRALLEKIDTELGK